jgi:hypothetical protein
MPCGGGNVALNVWATPEALLFYIASPDSWNGRTQVKMGRVRVTLSPNPFAGDFPAGASSRRQQHPHERSRRRWAAGQAARLGGCLPAGGPCRGAVVEAVHATAALEIVGGRLGPLRRGCRRAWRFRIDGPSPQRLDLIAKNHIEPPSPTRCLTRWPTTPGADGCPARFSPPARPARRRTKASAHAELGHPHARTPTTRIDLRATLRIASDPTVDSWERRCRELETRTRGTADADRARTAAWWRDFWDRSHIVINPGKTADDPAWEAGRNYQLFRAMLAANRSGRMPTLFNGGPFLLEANPNERQWGHAGFTAQNQRLVHWPMLKSGDADLLRVGLDFYADRHPPGPRLGEALLGHRRRGVPRGHRPVRPAGLHNQGRQRAHHRRNACATTTSAASSSR